MVITHEYCYSIERYTGNCHGCRYHVFVLCPVVSYVLIFHAFLCPLSFSCVFPMLQFVSFCLSVSSPLCFPPCYHTWPPPSSLSSPVPRLIVSVCVLSLCFPSCLCVYLLVSEWCPRLPCVSSCVCSVLFWYVLILGLAFHIFDLNFAFFVVLHLAVFVATLFSGPCTLFHAPCVFFLFCFFCIQLLLNKSLPFVPPQSCLLSYE